MFKTKTKMKTPEPPQKPKSREEKLHSRKLNILSLLLFVVIFLGITVLFFQKYI